MSELFSIQLQNRQQQGGDGVWLDLPTTTEQVQAALRQIGISSDNPQGLFISGYFAEEEKRFAIPYNMVLASNVDELNFLASRLETLSAGERAELNAALQAPQSELFSIGRITDFPENVDYYVHLPDVTGTGQLGDYYLNRSGMVDMPEEWKGGIDTAQFGRYVAQQEQGAFTQYGYLVKSGDVWQKVHEGQPVPEEYRVLSFPASEILRDAANIPPPVQPETEPQKVIPIILNGKDSAERMKEITDRLETGIQQLFDSDRYKAYLTTMAKFHNYSFNNTLLIAMQGGQLVAGFNKWKDTFHRTVKKGEKGIKILAPAPYKVKQKMEKLDEQGKPILDKDGKPLTEEKTVQIPAFKVVSVFDVSQTEGEPLPSIAVNELSGSVQDYQDFFKALEQASPVPIGFEDIEGGAHGYFHLLDNRIAIQEGMSQLQTIKTAIHEIAHAKLHTIDRTDPEHWLEYEVSFRVTKKTLPDIISRCMTRNGTRACAKMLDSIKAQGYKYSTLSAISVAVCDAVIPPQKDELIADADKQVSQVNKLFNRGLISENERYTQTINIWQATTDKVAKALAANLPKDNEIFMMADSGARGSMNQIKQLAGMRGLLANTAGKTIEMPIRANYREGLNILEYFVSARGARKGLADTALRTADSGYLTRRMVDVSQEVIVREIDCGTTDGLWVSEIHEGKEKIESFRERIIGRYAVGDVINPVTGEVIVPEGKMIDLYDANDIEAAGITKLKIRSLLTCRAKVGVCAHCYGSDMANGEPVQLGESIGVIAAESIGEPGTQLTMRTFHTGGIASAEDITQGLPRVEELFESRRPKSMAIMSEISGVVSQDDTKKNVVIKVTGKDENGAEVVKSYSIPFTQHARVMPGDRVEKGDIITREGVLYPQDILAIKGLSDVQNYLISEVQKVYRLQGVEINDKHIEVIVRQMCRKVRVTDSGSSDLIGGALANRLEVENINAELQKRIDDGEEGIKLVEYQQVLLGITKAALANESFLSAASFQETTRVLTEAAIKGKVDPLAGLKENVIIGKLIPAGTGLPEVREDLKRREQERDEAVAAELAAANQQ